MFTGIITAVGQITSVQDLGTSSAHGKRVCIQTPAQYLDDVITGDSIALNGACMTVVKLQPMQFEIEISAESLSKTCGLDKPGPVNLEKALRANDRLGGHLVAGHVDGLGVVTQFTPVGESWHLQVQVPQELCKYLAYKGSICINGVSLTVNEVQGNNISINLIAHTVNHTTLKHLSAGSQVNLEVDLIARYVERMLAR